MAEVRESEEEGEGEERAVEDSAGEEEGCRGGRHVFV